jgi:hypothetical protein
MLEGPNITQALNPRVARWIWATHKPLYHLVLHHGQQNWQRMQLIPTRQNLDKGR